METQNKIDQLTVIGYLKPGAENDLVFKQAWRRICQSLDSCDRRIKILKLIQEALIQLRLDVKYLQFDLQATRRERDLLEEKVRELGGEL